jgi:hypothetical protein
VFGAETPLAEITAPRISAWKADRLATTSRQTRGLLSLASVNRPLSILRALLRTAKWGELSAVPRIKRERGEKERTRWLIQLVFMVSRPGIEPGTPCLKGRCSAN